MKFIEPRPFVDPEAVARKLMELGNVVGPVHRFANPGRGPQLGQRTPSIFASEAVHRTRAFVQIGDSRTHPPVGACQQKRYRAGAQARWYRL